MVEEEIPSYQFPEEEIPLSKPKVSPKRFLLPLVIILALISIAGASFYFYQKIAKPDPISLLPQETAFYTRIKINPENQQVKNLKSLLNKFPYYEKISQKIDETFGKMKEENPVLKNLDFTLTDEMILAFISPLEEEKIEELPLVLILPNPNLKKLEKLARDVEKAIEESEDWKTEEETYKGRKILKAIPIVRIPEWAPPGYKPREPKFKPASTFTNGHFFLASKPEHIKKIIDVAEDQEITKIFKKDKIKGLTSLPTYKRIKEYLPKDYLLLSYGEIDQSKLLRTTKIEEVERPGLLSPFLASLKAALDLPFFKGKRVEVPEKVVVASAIIAEKNELKWESYSLDLREEPFLVSQFSFQDSLVNFIPEKIGNREVAFYTEGRNLKNSLEQISEQQLTAEQKREFEEALQKLEEVLEVNLKEDILALFDKNYAFFVAAESSGEETPTLGFVFEVDDENKVRENLLKIKIPKIEPEDIFGLSQSRKKAKDARITADMHQMRTMAEIIYSDYGSYWNFNCDFKDVKTLCQDIKEQVGSLPVIHQSSNKYCAFTQLNEPGSYYCIDSEMRAKKTYINPGTKGYCTGATFICPEVYGTPPPEGWLPIPEKLTEKVAFTKEIVNGFEVYALPVIEDFGLNFSIKDKKLVLAFTKEGLINILNSLSEPKKLKDSDIFTEQFKKIPKTISSISYTYPYGFLGVAKNLVKFYVDFMGTFMGGTISESEEAQIEKITLAINELLDKGVAPYLKILKSSGSYSYSPEENLTVAKGKLIIQELSEKEKRETEAFWTNFRLWLADKFETFY